jgi:electron transport complex protein RnfA
VELFAVLIGMVLINRFVLAPALPHYPLINASQTTATVLRVSLAIALALALSASICRLLETRLLDPLALAEWRLLVFVAVIAGIAQFTVAAMQRLGPAPAQSGESYLSLVTVNCVVLGAALLLINDASSFAAVATYGAGMGVFFTLLMLGFAELLERLEAADVPGPFRGVAIALVTAGMLSLAFSGFSGMLRG